MEKPLVTCCSFLCGEVYLITNTYLNPVIYMTASWKLEFGGAVVAHHAVLEGHILVLSAVCQDPQEGLQ